MVLHSLTHSTKTLELLNQQRAANAFTDFTIYVSGKKFPVHRALLAAHSPLIKRALDANEDRAPDINLDGVDCSCFAILLDFLYTANLNVNEDNVDQLLIASKFLEILSVVDLCSQFQQSSSKTSLTSEGDSIKQKFDYDESSIDINTTQVGYKRGRKPAMRVACPICQKEMTESRLKAHFRSHTGEKCATCRICGKSFANVYNLKIHARQHTGERPYRCRSCPRSFSDPSSLSKHKLWHSGVKRHKCRVCARFFSTRANVIEHMRTHTRERPFNCPQCGRNFSFRCDLLRHTKEHKGEVVGPCEHCGRTFNHTGNYKAHLRTHQKKIKSQMCLDGAPTPAMDPGTFVLTNTGSDHAMAIVSDDSTVKMSEIAELVAGGHGIEVVIDGGGELVDSKMM